MFGALLPLCCSLALQTPPAPEPPPVVENPADKAFRDEIVVERIPFPPVTVEPKRVATAAGAVKRGIVEDGSTVIGVTIGGESRAYPIDIVGGAEAVNDVLGGTPILVSWCVRCQAAIVYSRAVGEQTLTFGCQRALWRGSAVLYDVETGSLWSQPIGRAGAGPMRDRVLAPIASRLTAFSSWRGEHADTSVLAGPPSRRFQRSSFYVWDPKAVLKMGIVVRVGDAVRLYPLASTADGPGLFTDALGEVPVAVVFAPEHQVLQAYRREVGGKPIELALEPATAATPLALREVGGERRWRADSGRAIPLARNSTGSTGGTDTEPSAELPALERLIAYPLPRARFHDFFPAGTVHSDEPPRK